MGRRGTSSVILDDILGNDSTEVSEPETSGVPITGTEVYVKMDNLDWEDSWNGRVLALGRVTDQYANTQGGTYDFIPGSHDATHALVNIFGINGTNSALGISDVACLDHWIVPITRLKKKK